MQDTPLLPCNSAVSALRSLSGSWATLGAEPTESQREAIGALVSAGFIQFRFSIEVADLEPGRRQLHLRIVASGDFEPYFLPTVEATVRSLLPPGRAFNMRSRLTAIRRTTRGLAYLNSGCDPAAISLQPPLIRPGDVRWEDPPLLPSESAGVAMNMPSAEFTPRQESPAPQETLPDPEPEFTAQYLGLRLDALRRRLHAAGTPVTAELDPVQAAVLQRLLKNGEIWVQREAIEEIVSEVKTHSGHAYESADPYLAARLISKLRKVLSPFGFTIKNDRNGGYRIEKMAPLHSPRKKKARSR